MVWLFAGHIWLSDIAVLIITNPRWSMIPRWTQRMNQSAAVLSLAERGEQIACSDGHFNRLNQIDGQKIVFGKILV